MTTNIAGVYVTGLFDGNDILSRTQSELQASAMTDYMFWSVHVHSDGSLYYNNTLLVEGGVVAEAAGNVIGGLIAAARDAGQMRNAWFSIGAGQCDDYRNIQSILKQGGAAEEGLYANFQALMDLGADGFDLDYEENLSDAVSLISDLSVGLDQRMGARLTYCPHVDPEFWTDCLKANMEALGRQPVIGFNLQCYYGGAENLPTDWVRYLTAAGETTGVSDPTAFVRPGQSVAGSNVVAALTPDQMAARISGWGSPGGWIWNSSNAINAEASHGFTLADYATALLTAVPADVTA